MRRDSVIVSLVMWVVLLPQCLLAREPVLAKVGQSGRIVFGYSKNTPPFSFVDKEGNPAGYSLDLCRAVAEQVRRELKLDKLTTDFVPIQNSDRVNAVVNGGVDMDCNSTIETLSQMKRVDFTLMTFVSGTAMVSIKNKGPAEPSEIHGGRVAVISGSAAESVLENYLQEKQLSVDIAQVTSFDAGIGLLVQGSVQGFFSDRALLIGQILQSPQRDHLQLSEGMISFEPFAMILPRDDADFRLVANRALARIYGDRQIEFLYRKWFGLVGIRLPPLLRSVYRLQALPD